MPIIFNFPTGGGSGSGVALAAVSDISTLTASGKVYVKWTDPEDIILGGTALATWAGTLLVRKAGSMPASRRDGVTVVDSKTRNAYQSQYFCDSGLSNGTTYYYKFFPYSTDGVYTDNEDDEFTAVPGAVNLGNISNATVAAAGNGKIAVKWNDPAETVVNNGVTLATWASTKVVYKSGSYPTSPEDGTLAINNVTHNAYSNSPLTISGLQNGTTYYISFFPISTDGDVTSNEANRVSGTANRMTISAVPTTESNFTYDGNAKTPVWNGYDSNKMTMDGDTSATNAGNYTTTFTPLDDYQWNDSTTTAKSASWSIAKAAGSLTVQPESVTLNTSNPTAQVTVTRPGDGVITASTDDDSIATATVSGNIVTIHNVN